jgi:hypothetical protein
MLPIYGSFSYNPIDSFLSLLYKLKIIEFRDVGVYDWVEETYTVGDGEKRRRLRLDPKLYYDHETNSFRRKPSKTAQNKESTGDIQV